MNGKYQFSFDNRHVVSGLVAAAVVLGAVFVLGVLVGKKVALDQRATQAPDLLSALDDKAAAVEKPATPTLTFQEELTKSSPTLSAPAVASPAPAPAQAVARTATEAPSRATSGMVDTKQELAAVSTPSEPVGARYPTQQARPSAPVKSPAVKPEGKSGNFTLQLSSTQTRADANRFAARLREKGYAPSVVEAQVPGRGTWYRVRLGNFSSRETASRFLSDFRRETQLDAYIAAIQ